MRYINETVWGPIEPKWIGSYELELHDIVFHIFKKCYDTILDIGSAEGYYSVGFAHKIPGAKIYSYEIDPWSRAQQRRLAKINGLSNIVVRGLCTHKELDTVAGNRTLVVCDIEGSEFDLLDPTRSRKLACCDILVELHDYHPLPMKEVQHEITRRFEVTHSIKIIEATPRTVSSLTVESAALKADICLLNEYRSEGQVWLWMQAQHPQAIFNR